MRISSLVRINMTEASERSIPIAERLSRGLEALVSDLPWMADEKANRPKADFDVVVVGSGYGGAVAAAELSHCTDNNGRFLRVCIVERGKEYLPGMFPDHLDEVPGHLRFTTPNADQSRGVLDGLFDVRTSSDAVVLVASGLGGGSLINAGVMEMPHPSVFKESRWPAAIMRDKHLMETGRRLREWLSADPYAPDSGDMLKTKVLRTLSQGPITPVAVTVSCKAGANNTGVAKEKCVGCGNCATGCNYNAKQSLDSTLLSISARRETRIVTGASALRIERDNAGYWKLYVTHTDLQLRQREAGPFTLRASKIILSSGTMGSTEILLNSASAGMVFSDQLGRKFSANGDMLVTAHNLSEEARSVAEEFPAEAKVRPTGPTITGMIDLRTGNPETDLVIQDLAVPGPIRRLYEEAVTTFDVVNNIAEGDAVRRAPALNGPDDAAVDQSAMSKSLVLAMIGRDDAEGELRLNGPNSQLDGMLTVDWSSLKLDERFEQHHRKLRCLMDRARLGGRVVNNVMWRPLSDKLEAVFGRQRGPLLTVHPLGGCVMGDNVRQGVTNHLGQVFDPRLGALRDTYEGLCVLDGSIVPTSLGINPALTIAVLAFRAVDGLKHKWNIAGGCLGAAPDFPPCKTREHSLPSQRSSSGSSPTRIELTEQVRGLIRLRTGLLRYNKLWVEITLTTEPVKLRDLFERNAGTRRSFKICKGQLRILCPGRGFDAISDKQRPDDVALEASLSGSLRLFDYANTRRIPRTLRAFIAWFRNRGLRDIATARHTRFQERLRLKAPVDKGPQSNSDVPGGVCKLNSSAKALRDIWKLCSMAGATRTIEYDLVINGVRSPKAELYPGLVGRCFEGKRISTIKQLKYQFGSSPWTQLLEMEIIRFPRLLWPQLRRTRTLELNKRYLARLAIPLFRIVSQQNRVMALTDLTSFLLYALRVVLQVHSLSFRRPDAPLERKPQRLPGTINGLPKPEIEWLTVGGVSEPSPASIRLTRYNGATRCQSRDATSVGRPVVLIHGYSASGTTFAHSAVKGNLAQTLCDRGRDVWILDMRSSAGLLTATGDWAFETMAQEDIPIAIRHVLRTTGAVKVDVVAHCMGAAMFSMSVLGDYGGHNLSRSIGRAVLSQVGPAMLLSSTNVLAAYLMRYIRHFLPLDDYVFSRRGPDTLIDQLLDRALAAMRIPLDEFKRENPFWPPGKATPWVGTRHRMDALYAKTFSLKNMPDEVLDHIDDFFGPLSVATVSQVLHFASYNCVTDRRGINRYVVPALIKKHLSFPIMSIHGAENGLSDPATLRLMKNVLEGAGFEYLNPNSNALETDQETWEMKSLIRKKKSQIKLQGPLFLTWRIKNHGHQDCLIGSHAGKICDVLADFLSDDD